MKTKSTLALAVGAVLITALTGSVQAVPIAGVISFSGSASADNSNLETATEFLTFGTVTVGQEAGLSGDYAGTAEENVTFTPFTFDPVGASLPIAPLWTYTVDGITYSFTLESLNVDFVSPDFLNLSGIGTASITGKEDTVGLFLLSGQTFSGEANFTFSASAEVPAPRTNVPDGGATALLLGFSVLGFGLLKRKSAA